MRLFYFLWVLGSGLACLLLALGAQAQAQAYNWVLATSGPHASSTSGSSTNAVATDDVGNVYVTGTFRGTLSFGSIVLTSDNANVNTNTSDLFVAKYVPSTNTWAWAQRGGGTYDDEGTGIALYGTSVYITGIITNTNTNAQHVTLGGTNPANSPVQVNGASSTSGKDLFVAKYTDMGTSAALSWTQVGGGGGIDVGTAIAVNGQNVYVTGYITNNLANARAVVFGGTGTTPGTTPQYGASSLLSEDIIVAKYTDNGSSATLKWTQVAGGKSVDIGFGIAVSNSNVYVVGSLTNDLANIANVTFGGAGIAPGTVPQYGASSTTYEDMVLAKYTDAGASASVSWTQVAGGTDHDAGRGIAVNNNQVYVTGFLTNSQANAKAVVVGGSGTVPGTVAQYGASAASSQDLLVAKYLDNGTSASVAWTQIAGGSDIDWGTGIALSSNHVFVTGFITNTLTNANGVVFGGTGITAGTAVQPGATPYNNYDLVVASYADSGPTTTVDWTRVGGGQATDWGLGIALGGLGVYVVGQISVPAMFGGLTVSGSASDSNFLGALSSITLPARSSSAGAELRLYPNPATGLVTLAGAASGSTVQVLSALGQLVATATADASGTARLVLPGGLAGGVYVVRAGARALRLVVE